MRFDTLDKKPKLYNVLILTAVFALIEGILLAVDAKKLSVPICAASLLYLVAVIVLLVRAFVRQLRYNPYSYNTIYYIGFALFLVSMVITHVILLASLISSPELYHANDIFRLFMNSARLYMLFSAPFLLLFAAALCISNISLLRHERKRFVNVLGILLSLLMIGGWLFMFFYDYYVTGSEFEVMMHDLFGSLFSAVYLYFECMLIGAIIANVIVVRYEPEKNKDFAVILGCGLRPDGTPTPLLKGRIDRAIAFYERQKAETGKELTFVTSGGQGPGEANSESLAMKNYLLERGIPEERIIEEDRSSDTMENMRFSKEKITERDPDAKVIFATTNYHVFRAGLCARRVKMRAVGVGAKTKWYFWPNAAVREFVGLLSAHKLKQAIVLGCMVVFYVVMTVLAYKNGF